MRTRNALLGVVVAAAVAAGAVVPALAEADTAPTGEQPPVMRDGDRAQHQQRFAAALAEELGLPETEVADAIERVRDGFREQDRAGRIARLEERLDAAVEAGDLTREQADAFLDAHEAGVAPLGRGDGQGQHGGDGRHGGGGRHGDVGPHGGGGPHGGDGRHGGHGGRRGPAMLDG
jgi:hypothetical protein